MGQASPKHQSLIQKGSHRLKTLVDPWYVEDRVQANKFFTFVLEVAEVVRNIHPTPLTVKGGDFVAVCTSKSSSCTSWNSLRLLRSCVKLSDAPLSANNSMRSCFLFILHFTQLAEWGIYCSTLLLRLPSATSNCWWSATVLMLKSETYL